MIPPNLEPLLHYTAEDIRRLRPGLYSDQSLVDLVDHFIEQSDNERQNAVYELILRSFEHDETLFYNDLYAEVVRSRLYRQDWAAARRWAYAWLAYSAQRYFLDQQEDEAEEEDEEESSDYTTDAICALAATYLDAGEPHTALTILLRWQHHTREDTPVVLQKLSEQLWDFGYFEWALIALDRLLALLPEDNEERNRILAWKTLIEDNVQAKSEASALTTPETTAFFYELLNVIEQPDPTRPRYLPPLDRLAATGEVSDEEAAAIVARGRELAPDLIGMAFDRLLADGPAPDTAVALLRRLWESGVAELDELAGFLSTATPGWQRRLLRLFGKIGPVSLEQLTAVATDPTLGLAVRLSAIEALEEYAHKVPEERPAVIALLHDVITHPVAPNPAAEEDLVAFAISTALELDARELASVIEAAFREDRVNPWIISFNDVAREWQWPIKEKVSKTDKEILLICQKCHRYRYYVVEHITIDLETLEKEIKGESARYSPFIMDREIICPKCGARDRYKVEAIFYTPLLMNEYRSIPVTSIRGYAFNQPMHPLEAVERYKMRILTHPRRAENYMRLGNILRLVHRADQALAMIRKGHELEPDHLEWTLMRATAEHDLGDKNLARRYYEEALRLAEKAQKQGQDATWFVLLANKGLEALARREPSPWFDLYREELNPDEAAQLDFENL